MKLYKYLVLAFLMACATQTFAGWDLIDDMEGDPANPKYTYVVDQTDRTTPVFNYVSDPQNANNTAFWIDPVSYGTEWAITYVNWVLPTPIPEGGVGTYFFRFYPTDNNAQGPVLGLTDVPYAFDDALGEPVQPTGWGAYESAVAVTRNIYRVRDGGAYVDTAYTFEPQKWYNIWGVAYNKIGTAEDETYWYAQGPDDAAPVHVLVPDGSGGTYDSSLFRNGTEEALIGFIWGILAGDPNSPNSGIPSYIDDIYVYSGVDVFATADTSDDNPTAGGVGPKSWGGYDWVNETGDIDTGSWLGWMNVLNAPYVFSYTLGWAFMPEPAESAVGGWMYIYK